MFKYERGKGLLYCTSLLAQAMCRNVTGRHWKKNFLRSTLLSTLGKKLKHWEKKLRNVYFEHLLQLKSLFVKKYFGS
jgi:hypothetical protein